MEYSAYGLPEGDHHCTYYRYQNKTDKCKLGIDDQHENDIPYENKEYRKKVAEHIRHEITDKSGILCYPVEQFSGSSVIDKTKRKFLILFKQLAS